MLKIDENVDIKKYCTLKIGGTFRYFCIIKNIDELNEAISFAKEKNLKTFILGGGSNLVFNDSVLDFLVLKIEILGFEIITETDQYVDIKVGAGENWDTFVARTVSMNLSGIEALSAIPGTVGATPVQNVGAYGQEVKDTIVSIDVCEIPIVSMHENIETTLKTLDSEDCVFGYRDSIFKNETARGVYMILFVKFRLSKKAPTTPNYPGVKKYFEDKGITNPTLLEIREAIISIRSTKLPDPKIIANVGSFFKNPIVKREVAEDLKKINPSLAIFELNPILESFVKIPAGWLLEQSGLKGKSFGSVSVYDKNALVLVNNGDATFADLENVKNQIIQTVYDKFGITLEPEPEFVKY